ncbi:bacteriocin fulvocin C-related protein [Streptomyces sp. NPDC026294]|uniref:bacteriocin fulvocin C-related protein n=1 Tax=Streptomyces sp. NPDC026294 TaxID=3155362 RepID=UPI0033CD50CD
MSRASRLPAPGSRLPAPGSRLPAPGSRLPAQDTPGYRRRKAGAAFSFCSIAAYFPGASLLPENPSAKTDEGRHERSGDAVGVGLRRLVRAAQESLRSGRARLRRESRTVVAHASGRAPVARGEFRRTRPLETGWSRTGYVPGPVREWPWHSSGGWGRVRPSVRSAPSTTCAGRPVRLTAQPLPHRQAVWAALPPAARSRLWVEQLARYRRAHPGPSPEQSDVLEEVHHIAAQESTFAFDRVADPGPAERALRESADRHFGRAEANPLFAAIGPAETSGRRGAKALNCNCSVESNYCSSSACHDNQCMKGRCDCRVYQRSCGCLWRYPCDGFRACSSC